MKKTWGKPLAGITILCFFLAPFETTFAATSLFPKEINYQAKLTNASGVAVPDGSYNITFRLYTTAVSATTTNIWEETHTGANRIPLTSGLLSTMMGTVTSLSGVNFNQPLYLGVEVGGTSSTPVWDGEMSPRKQLGAVPAALVADTLDGLDSSAFVQTNGTSTIASSSAQTLLTLNQSGAGNVLDLFGSGGANIFSALSSGNVGIGTTSPYAKLSVVGEVVASFFTATSTTATSTFANHISIGVDKEYRIGGVGVLTRVNGSSALLLGDTSGNTRGARALDLQSARTLTTQVSSGDDSAAVGLYNQNAGSFSSAFGLGNTTTFSYQAQSAFGYGNLTSGNNASAIGVNNIANSAGGFYSPSAVGYQNLALAGSASAFGASSTASGLMSSAFGYNNIASGQFSTAFGASTTASGLFSSSFGYNNITSAQGATAVGSNITNSIASSTQIGPSDAAKLTILSSGNIGIGTTSPYAKLSVVGQTLSDSFNATSSVGYQLGGTTLLTASSTGSNTIIGLGAGASITSGATNTFVGDRSGRVNTTGSGNTANGSLSLFTNTTGNNNVSNGSASLFLNTTGSNNTANGYFSLWNNTTGTSTTAIGFSSGYSNTTGNANTFLGANAGNTDGTITTPGTLSNATAIGYNAQVTASNSLILGGTGAYGVNVGIGTTTPLNKLSVIGNVSLGDFANTSFEKVYGADGVDNTGIYVIDKNSRIGTWQNASSLEGITVDSSGNRNGYGNLWLNYYSPSYVNIANGGGSVSVGVDTGSYLSKFVVNGNQTIGGGYTGVAAPAGGLLVQGNVGIGTTSPYAKLSVAGEIVGANFTGTSTATSTFGGNLAINGTGTTTSNGGFNISAGCFAVGGVCVGGSGTTGSGTTGQLPYYAANGTALTATSSLFIKSDSSVGVNNTNPLAQLDIRGSTNVFKATNTNGGDTFTLGDPSGNGLYLRYTTSAGFQTTNDYVVYSSGSSGGSAGGGSFFKINPSYVDNASYVLNVEKNNAPYFVVRGDGNIGIGTTSPYAKLSIVGSATSSPAIAFADPLGNTSLEFRAGTSTLYNTFIGVGAGQANTTGFYSTANGYSALYSNTTGSSNTANGYSALYSNTTGSLNTANGYSALYSNTTGSSNTANGYSALYLNTTGFYNTANGVASLRSNTTGSYNTANGYSALFSNTTGSFNDANGYYSLYSNTTGSSNTANGYYSLYSNTIGASSTAVGYQAGYSNTTGNFNTFLGFNAGYTDGTTATLGTLTNATAIGYNAQVTASNSLILGGTGAYGVNVGIGTTTPYAKLSVVGQTLSDSFNATSSVGYQLGGTTLLTASSTGFNTFIGFGVGTSTTNGAYNTFTGYQSGQANTTGANNTANGYRSLFLNTSGYSNTANGTYSLLSNTTGYYNSAIGSLALTSNTTGANNIAIGGESLKLNTTGSFNTANGSYSLYFNSTGTSSTAIGYQAGFTNTTGSQNVFVGYNADAASGALTNATAIGANAIVGASNSLVLGGTGAYGVNVGIGTTTPYAKLSVVGQTLSDSFNATSSVGYQLNGQTLATASSTMQNYFFAGATTTNAINGQLFAAGYNIAMGQYAMQYKSSGTSNFAVGYQALMGSSTVSSSGAYNNALGASALYANTSGSYNNALGVSALYSNTTGSYNNALGTNALWQNTTGSYNNALGYQSLNSNTTGSYNNALGYWALITNTTGQYNNAFGYESLYANTTGSINNAFGPYTLYSNTSGVNNNALGWNSLYTNTIGSYNNALGQQSLWQNSTGSYNNAFGYGALEFNTTGSSSQAIGWNALFNNTTGASSTALGAWAGKTNTTGNNNLYLGDEADSLTASLSNAIAIGSHAKVGASNSLVLGGTGAYGVNVGIGTTTPLSMLSVVGTTTIGSLSTGTQAGLQIGNGGLCVDNDGTCVASTTGRISAVSYTTGSTDLAENYFSSTPLDAGNIVMTEATNTPAYITLGDSANTNRILGIVSTKPAIILGLENDMPLPNQYPIALAGRVPVSVNLENGPIKQGDRITISNTPGVGAKAVATSSVTVGIALEDWDGVSNTMDTMATGTVLAFVNLAHTDLSAQISGSQFNLTGTSSALVPLFGLDDETGDVRYLADRPFNFSAQSLINVKSIVSSSGKWSISEDGKLVVEEVNAKRINAEEEICIKDVCVNRDQLNALLMNASLGSGSGSSNTTPVTTDSGGGNSSPTSTSTSDTSASSTADSTTSTSTPSVTPSDTSTSGGTSSSTPSLDTSGTTTPP